MLLSRRAPVDTESALVRAEAEFRRASDVASAAAAAYETARTCPWTVPDYDPAEGGALAIAQSELVAVVAKRDAESARRTLAIARRAHAVAIADPVALAADVGATIAEVEPVVQRAAELRADAARLLDDAAKLERDARQRLVACYDASATFGPRVTLPMLAVGGLDLRDIPRALAALRAGATTPAEPLPHADKIAELETRIVEIKASREAERLLDEQRRADYLAARKQDAANERRRQREAADEQDRALARRALEQAVTRELAASHDRRASRI